MFKDLVERVIETKLGAIAVPLGTISMSIAQIFELLHEVVGFVGVLSGLVACCFTAMYWREKYLTARDERLKSKRIKNES